MTAAWLRLTASAALLGWPCNAGAARAALTGPPGQPARLRLTLDAGGRIEATRAPLPPARPEWRLALAAARLDADDPWLAIKTTRRAVFDAARAALPAGIDEAIFLNQRGEVCEGTITNVFAEVEEGQFVTPALSSGLLPGILRADLIRERKARSEVMRPEDLRFRKLFVGNSLRGLIRAELVEGDA